MEMAVGDRKYRNQRYCCMIQWYCCRGLAATGHPGAVGALRTQHGTGWLALGTAVKVCSCQRLLHLLESSEAMEAADRGGGTGLV